MNKKTLVNKLKTQKGITGADVMISLLIILTTLEVITMVYVNLTNNSRQIDRKTGATRIATAIIENIDMVDYDKIETTMGGRSCTVEGGESIFSTSVPKGYTVTITVADNGFAYDVVKKIDVKVEYLDGVTKTNKDVSLSKVYQRQIVRECNSPQFTGEYLEQLIPAGVDYTFAGNVKATSNDTPDDTKVICPVKYDAADSCYKIVAEDALKSLWYSYSNKQWARVVVMTKTDYGTNVSSDGKLSRSNLLINEGAYVWIPRFGVDSTGALNPGTFFKYKTTNLGIQESTDGFLHYEVEEKNWNPRSISFDTDQKLGKWSPYSDLYDGEGNPVGNTDASYLNDSQYGPLLNY